MTLKTGVMMLKITGIHCILKCFSKNIPDPRHLINSVYCEYNKRSDVFLSEVAVIGSKLLHVSREAVYTSLL